MSLYYNIIHLHIKGQKIQFLYILFSHVVFIFFIPNENIYRLAKKIFHFLTQT